MLLNEIVSTDKIIKVKGTPKIPGEPIGEGYFAKVYPGRKTNTVIKVANAQNPDDAYINFIREAMDHQDNPFFPRVYNAKIYKTDPDQNLERYKNLTKYEFVFVVETERLIPLTSEKIYDSIPHILEQLGIKADELISDTGQADKRRDYDQDSEERHFILSTKLNAAFEEIEQLKHMTDNQQFIEALNAVERLHQKGHNVDMHAANAMVRLTSTGPQLVLTDPVAF